MEQKTVLVTGASRGIGRAIATKFLKEGHKVYGTYFSSENKINELVKEFGEENVVKVGPFDLTKIEDIYALVDEISGVKFDTLVLNAGTFSENDDFVNFDLDEFNSVMNCNFYSQLIIATKMQNYIKNGGNIVLMSSNDAYSGAYGSMSYSISKSAVVSLMKCLSVNYGRRGIRVNSIAPGAIDTDMNTPEQEFEAPLWTPIKRIAQPYEVANVVYFLSSDESSFINGDNITIDGGYGNVSVLLKEEIESSRKIVGYEWLNSTFESLQAGDKVYCYDTTPEYGWIHNPDEKEYIEQNIAATKRGVELYRIIMTPSDQIEKIVANDLIQHAINESTDAKFIGIVSDEAVKKHNRTDYPKIGAGFVVVIRKDGTKELFIDSFSDNENVGYVIDNEMMIESLIEVFEKIYANIKKGLIQTHSAN